MTALATTKMPSKGQIVIPEEILKEYQQVEKVLSEKFPDVDLDPILGLFIVKAE